MINWQFNCPNHVKQLREYYHKDKFTSQGFFTTLEKDNNLNSKHYLLDCELGNSEKQNILEAINLSLFNLNNEEID